MSCELGFHFVSTRALVVVTDVVFRVVNGFAVVDGLITNFVGWPCAVTAKINISAHATLKVVSGILLAR